MLKLNLKFLTLAPFSKKKYQVSISRRGTLPHFGDIRQSLELLKSKVTSTKNLPYINFINDTKFQFAKMPGSI